MKSFDVGIAIPTGLLILETDTEVPNPDSETRSAFELGQCGRQIPCHERYGIISLKIAGTLICKLQYVYSHYDGMRCRTGREQTYESISCQRTLNFWTVLS
jgi:hypothetical protein